MEVYQDTMKHERIYIVGIIAPELAEEQIYTAGLYGVYDSEYNALHVIQHDARYIQTGTVFTITPACTNLSWRETLKTNFYYIDEEGCVAPYEIDQEKYLEYMPFIPKA